MAMRNPDGRFNGSTPGPGRPRREVERSYLEATITSCPLADWKAIVKRAVKDAKAGSATARRWLSDVLIGRDPLALRDLIDELRDELEGLRDGRDR